MLEYYGHLWQGQALSELWPSGERGAAKSYIPQMNEQSVTCNMCSHKGETITHMKHMKHIKHI